MAELHRLRALASQLAGHDNLAALGAALSNRANDTLASTANGQAAQQLEPAEKHTNYGRMHCDAAAQRASG